MNSAVREASGATPLTFSLRIDEQLELRQRRPEDAGELFALTDANRDYLREWLPWLDYCISADDTLKNIEYSMDDATQGTGLAVGIWECGRIVGVTGFHSIDKASRVGQMGYWLSREHQGRGIMTRSVGTLVEHAFKNLGLNRITIAAATRNLASRAVAERLGFHLEGIAREAEWLYGRVVDHAVYALTHADWQKAAKVQKCETGVRAFQARDIPNAIQLWSQTEGVSLLLEETPDFLVAFLDRNPGLSSAVVGADGKLIGALLGGDDGRRGYLYHLAVNPAHRGTGLGRALVRRTTTALAERGIAKATIMVFSNNSEGAAFWEHLGWKARHDLRPMQMQL